MSVVFCDITNNAGQVCVNTVNVKQIKAAISDVDYLRTTLIFDVDDRFDIVGEIESIRRRRSSHFWRALGRTELSHRGRSGCCADRNDGRAVHFGARGACCDCQCPCLPQCPSSLVGFVLIAILDPIAARRGQAPLFFARLRPRK
jgi:hypothetical protein